MLFLERLVQAFDENKIPYAIVGGVAVALHGAPRGTVDINIVIKHSEKFFINLAMCMKNFGFEPRLPVTASEVYQFRAEYIARRNLIATSPEEYGFYANVNPTVDHPRWTQSKERRIGELFKRKTLMFNGYDQVAGLYAGMDLRKEF